MSQRTLVALAIGFAILCAAIVWIAMSAPPAHGATCSSRPGVSHGSVWWRWRYSRTGARCWYPGSRYASRRVRSRPAELRTNVRASPARPNSVPESQPVEEPPAIRAVRVISLFNGITASERIERAFDRLMIFPVEGDDECLKPRC